MRGHSRNRHEAFLFGFSTPTNNIVCKSGHDLRNSVLVPVVLLGQVQAYLALRVVQRAMCTFDWIVVLVFGKGWIFFTRS